MRSLRRRAEPRDESASPLTGPATVRPADDCDPVCRWFPCRPGRRKARGVIGPKDAAAKEGFAGPNLSKRKIYECASFDGIE